jgi:hypothetical protein
VVCSAACATGQRLVGVFECAPPLPISASAVFVCVQVVTSTIMPVTDSRQREIAGISSKSTVVVAAAVAGSVVFIVALVVLVFFLMACRQHRQKGLLEGLSHGGNKRISSKQAMQLDQLELLLARKVEQLFALSFAGEFDGTALLAAREAFLALEVPRRSIKLHHIIGQGQGGDVHFGVMLPTSTEVAVKIHHAQVDTRSGMLLSAVGEEALQLEARLLHQLQHPHIVQVLAVVTMSFPTWICLEFMPNGDLKTYLRFAMAVIGLCNLGFVDVRFAGHAGQRCASERRM